MNTIVNRYSPACVLIDYDKSQMTVYSVNNSSLLYSSDMRHILCQNFGYHAIWGSYLDRWKYENIYTFPESFVAHL